MAGSEPRRRRRPAVSCTLCRRRKIRCNREQPCNNCLRSRKDVACVYEDLPPAVHGRLQPRPEQRLQLQPLQQPQQPQQSQDLAGSVLPPFYTTPISTGCQTVAAAVPLRPPPTTLPTRSKKVHPPFDYATSLGQPTFADDGRMERATTLSEDDTRALRRRIRELEKQLRVAQRSHGPARTASAIETAQQSPLQPELRSPDADADTDSPLSRLELSTLPDTPSTAQSHIQSVADWPLSENSDASADQMHPRVCYRGIPGYGQFTSRNVMHKTRLFGQSHWINSIVGFRDLFDLVESIANDKKSKIFVDIHRLKHLARIIKAQRAPQWPAVLPSSPAARRRDLPPRPLADQLVQCYLRSSEGLFRVLHVPLFRKDYEAFWADAGAPAATSSSSAALSAGLSSGSLPASAPDTPFLIQLRLVLAIGAASHPEHARLRHNAVRWVHQALCWAAEPDFKAHLTIQTLQNNVLLLLAREAAGLGSEMTWTAVGSLLRSAVYMGLHRDPLLLPKQPTNLAVEMRRRLWNTILELAVNTGLTAGGPAMLSLADFDTKPPGNFDDEELLGAAASVGGVGGSGADHNGDSSIDRENLMEDRQDISTEGRPPNVFTQTSVAIALRKTFPLRLAIVKFLNNLGPRGSYDETLQIDKEFRAVYRALCQTLDSFQRNGQTPGTGAGAGADAQKPIPRIQLALIDLMLRRYLLCLHVPFFGTAVHDMAAYAFSRRVVVDTVVKIWNICTSGADDFSQSMSNIPLESLFPPPSPSPFSDSDELVRIALLGSGPVRKLTVQAGLLVAAEIKLKLLEDIAQDDTHLMSALASSGPEPLLAPVRLDLLNIVRSACDWCLRSIEAGEVNCKGLLFCCIILTQINDMRRGMMQSANATYEKHPGLLRELVRTSEESLDACMSLLERHVAEGQARMEAEAKAAAADEEAVVVGRAVVEVSALPDCGNSAATTTSACAASVAAAATGTETSLDFSVLPDHLEGWDFLMADIQMSDLGRGSEPYNWMFPNEPAQELLW